MVNKEIELLKTLIQAMQSNHDLLSKKLDMVNAKLKELIKFHKLMQDHEEQPF